MILEQARELIDLSAKMTNRKMVMDEFNFNVHARLHGPAIAEALIKSVEVAEQAMAIIEEWSGKPGSNYELIMDKNGVYGLLEGIAGIAAKGLPDGDGE